VGCLSAVDIGELDLPNNNQVRLIKNHNNLAATLHQIVNSVQTPEAKSMPLILHNSIRPKNATEIKQKNPIESPKKLPVLTAFRGQTRAFLKVQDGCDGACAYCIVPKTRPTLDSKPVEAVLDEAQGLVNAGHKEIVVTGIYLGAYGRDTVRRRKWQGQENPELAGLLERLAKIPGLERIRLSSLEPGDVAERLLAVFEGNRNLMPHLHLSLQSGSSAILKRMRRQYTADFFLSTVEMIKKRLDRPAITTDIIVGFPGETDEDFQQTVELAEEIGFAKMHVFPFSARRGTAAAKMQPTVNNRVIKERAKSLRNLDVRLAGAFRGEFVGETSKILLENSGSYASGRSERYFIVRVKNPPKSVRKNELLKVRLTGNGATYAVGEVVAEPVTAGGKKNSTQTRKFV